VQTPAAGFVVAGDDDLFLLDGQAALFQGWILVFDYRGIEAVVVLERCYVSRLI